MPPFPKLHLSQKQIALLAGGAIIIILVIILIWWGLRPATTQEEIQLTVWGVDPSNSFDQTIAAYLQARPNVKVGYVEVSADTYEETLFSALAAGQGPDVFMIGNRSLPKFKNILTPVPQIQFDRRQIRDLFPQVVEHDFTDTEGIYALPLYVDTLALFYNKDLFDQAGIISPPPTWNDFQNMVPLLRSLNPSRQIVRAGAAIGGSERNVEAGVDLLHLLMLQNGTKMTSGNQASFHETGVGNPGLQAFNFYLQFANAASPFYTWNDSQPYSVDSFAGGGTAMMLNYASAIATVKEKSPFLNFGVAPAPQPLGASVSISYPRYHGFAVSKQTKAPGWAWDFVIFAATNLDAARAYFTATKHPPALRPLIGEYVNDPDWGIFARQALTARSWYEVDPQKVTSIFNNSIVTVLTGQLDSARALRQAADQISQLMTQSAVR